MNKLRSWIKRHKFTLKELAEKLELSPHMVSRIASRQSYDIKSIYLVSTLTGIDMLDLMPLVEVPEIRRILSEHKLHHKRGILVYNEKEINDGDNVYKRFTIFELNYQGDELVSLSTPDRKTLIFPVKTFEAYFKVYQSQKRQNFDPRKASELL